MCTRTVYLGVEDMVVTGRNMDWPEDPQSNLWLFPRGMPRDGAIDTQSITWSSRFGSVVAAGYDVGTADGMNEKGLVANALYLAQSDYGAADGRKPTLSVGAWPQYVLDNHATVADAVAALRSEPFVVVAPALPNGKPASMHLAISDASGDSAIFEYIRGTLTIHHDRAYRVTTNTPLFHQQLALDKYWQQIGGTTMLPGTNRDADRFVRASFLIGAAGKTADAREAVATSFAVMRALSVPPGIAVDDQPNVAKTVWRTVADQKNRVYYYEHLLSPGALWVKLGELDFKAGSGVRTLTLVQRHDVIGDATARFTRARAFSFLAAAA
jgi:penicillin V acylase-like amidase (Ntn superfamily)